MERKIIALLFLFLSGYLSAQGFDDDYRVFEGDNNFDGQLDFYVRKTNLVLLHGDVVTPIEVQIDGFVLQQNADGTFSILSDVSFSNADWEDSSVSISVQDFNLDGVMDAFLVGVDNGINGLHDLIVFSNENEGSPPIHVKSVDQDLKQFIGDVSSWATDSNYFTQQENFLGNQCVSGYNRPKYGWYYDYFLDAQVYGVVGYTYVCTLYAPVYDLSGFSQDAISLVANLEAITDVNGIWDIVSGSSIGINISDILEDVFGTTIFGGVLKNGGLLDIEITLGLPGAQLSKDRGERLRVGLVTAGVETEAISAEIRSLTASEVVLALGNGLKIPGFDKVKVVRAALGSDPFKVATKYSHIYIPDNNTAQLLWSNDYGSVNPSVSNVKRSIFVHELTHIYQWRKNRELPLFSTDNYCYMPLTAPYGSYNHEQRAEMVKDRFLLRISEIEYLSAIIPCNDGVELSVLEAKIDL